MTRKTWVAGDLSWQAWASCLEVDPDSFFPVEHAKSLSAENNAAIRLCHGCPVQAECLDYALAQPDGTVFGIWGGTTAHGRDRIRGTGHFSPGRAA